MQREGQDRALTGSISTAYIPPRAMLPLTRHTRPVYCPSTVYRGSRSVANTPNTGRPAGPSRRWRTQGWSGQRISITWGRAGLTGMSACL